MYVWWACLVEEPSSVQCQLHSPVPYLALPILSQPEVLTKLTHEKKMQVSNSETGWWALKTMPASGIVT